MSGLMVVGTGPDAREELVAEAARAAAGGHARAFAAAGPVADPAALVAEARAAAETGPFLVASAPGGLLAPLTPRYAVVDLANELGLPLVIAARAGPGLVNAVRLTLVAADAARLPVAAVVLTDWPDAPDQGLLDERALLEQPDGVPVHALADGNPGWPVAEWAGGAPHADASAGRLELEPYETWRPRNVGDPRGTPRPRIMEALIEIVGSEGPMTASRAYSIYNRASGGKKLTSVARAPLSSAAHWLAKEGKLDVTRESDIPWQGDDVLRLPGTPAVRVREIGPRSLEEVPLDEIAELVRRLRAAHRIEGDPELKRAVLSAYGLRRLTAKADEYLGLALDLASA